MMSKSEVSENATKILTRAARRRGNLAFLKFLNCSFFSLLAGLTSPPSVFKKCRPKKSPPADTVVQEAEAPAAEFIAYASSSSEDEGESSRRELWVQCDNPSCGKWRLLPTSAEIDAQR